MNYVGISIHLPRKEALRRIREAAKREGVSVSTFVRVAAEKAAERALRQETGRRS